jgi:hypothetical protein
VIDPSLIMKFITIMVFCAVVYLMADAESALKLDKTIPLPDVRGRIDHMALDAQGRRLFVAALGNNTVEVVDLEAGKRVQSIAGCDEPQGIVYVPGKNRLFIANGGSGVVAILDATTFKVLNTIDNLPDADNVRYDGRDGLVYVGYGDGGLAVIGAENGDLIAKIPIGGHPESFQLEQSGSRIFVNVPDSRQIVVVDRDKRAVTAKWPMEEFRANFPMALDEADHRLFIGCRHPARMVVLDTGSGKRVVDAEIDGDTDDLFYDAGHRQVYVSCGAGTIDVIAELGPDKLELRERIPTVGGARTSYFVADRGELFVAVRAGLISGGAEIRVYQRLIEK